MIDLEKARQEFRNYTNTFDVTNFDIRRKIYHSFRVENYARLLAENTSLDKDLADIIGLLHDIGRFEQLSKYNTYNDTISVDHAHLGVEILSNNNYIDEYTNQDHDIILTAIENHNKYAIDSLVTGDTLLYSKLIRDADKIDILDLVRIESSTNSIGFDTVDQIRNSKISDNVYRAFISGKSVKKTDMQTAADEIFCSLAFLYDINFTKSYELIKKNNSINIIIDQTKGSIEEDRFEYVRSLLNKYIDTKLGLV